MLPIADANHFKGRKVGRNETCLAGRAKIQTMPRKNRLRLIAHQLKDDSH